MIQVAMRAKTMSFDPLALIFTEKMIGQGQRSTDIIKSPQKDEKGLNFMGNMHNAMHESLIPGPALHSMNARVLRVVSDDLVKISPEFETRPLWLWLRKTFTTATALAIFGSKSPFTDNPALIQQFWYVYNFSTS
jgi:hypothetical protein